MRTATFILAVTAFPPASLANGQIPIAARDAPASVLVATRAATPPRLDGIDGDAVWAVAERRQDFRTFSPREDGEPTFRTEMRVAYDDRALYLFVRAFDPRPDSIVRLLSRRDTDGPPNDQVQLFIDSFYDRRSGYEYIVNAAGVKSDYLLFDDTGFDQSSDGVWDVATRVDSAGWTAEYAIPLQQLRFSNRDAPLFGIMLWRLVGRTGERVSWPAYRPSRSGYVSQTGTLQGLRGLVRPPSLEAAPVRACASAQSTRRRVDRHAHDDRDAEAVMCGFFPGLTSASMRPSIPTSGKSKAIRPCSISRGSKSSIPRDVPSFSRVRGSSTSRSRPTAAPSSFTPVALAELRCSALSERRVAHRNDDSRRGQGHSAPNAEYVCRHAVRGNGGGGRRAKPSQGTLGRGAPAHFAVARLQRDFRSGRSGVGLDGDARRSRRRRLGLGGDDSDIRASRRADDAAPNERRQLPAERMARRERCPRIARRHRRAAALERSRLPSARRRRTP